MAFEKVDDITVHVNNKLPGKLMEKKTEMPQRGRRIGKDAWVIAARDALIKGGLEAIKIERLAKAIDATRAAFYWHFTDRNHLLLELLNYWRSTSTKAYEAVVERDFHDGKNELEAINNMWLEEKDYEPALDSAMRDWARVSVSVAQVVREVDRKRIDILKVVFCDLGYEETEAFIRARVAYFHQVGYIALGLDESKDARDELAPIYLKVLLGGQ